MEPSQVSDLLFLKLGGSLLTDKSGHEALRAAVLARLAGEIQSALAARPGLRLLIGHGSGSYGHVAAAHYRTHEGVVTNKDWRGFAEVADAAARLNRLVCTALLEAGVPALSIQPSASASANQGELISLALGPVTAALDAGLVPILFGDVAFDSGQGGTIISTEQVLGYLVQPLDPEWLLLAGDTDGVYANDGAVVPQISHQNIGVVSSAIGGSGGTDVTGGMSGKVAAMLALTAENPGLSIRIFSGLEPGVLETLLRRPATSRGTLIG